MHGIYEDEQSGELYRVVMMGELVCPNMYIPGAVTTLSSVCIYQPLHVDKAGMNMVMSVVNFQRVYRKLSPGEFESRVEDTLKEAREKAARDNGPYVWNPPKDGEIAGLPKFRGDTADTVYYDEKWDERDLQRGYRRGYDFQGTDNRE